MRYFLVCGLLVWGMMSGTLPRAWGAAEVVKSPGPGQKQGQKQAQALRSFRINSQLKVTVLNANSYVVTDTSFYDSNVLVAKLPGDVVVIASSPIDTAKTTAMLEWIKQDLKPNKLIAINTHFHADGTAGNEAYQKYGAEIWSSEQTRDLYQKRAASMRPGLAAMVKDPKEKANILETKTVPANQFFKAKQGHHWKFKDQEVIVTHPGPAHSPDNLVVYLPQQKILFGGCLIRALDYTLGNTKDANLTQYPKTTKNLLKYKAKVVIPGHGQLGNQTLIHHTIDLANKAKK